MIFRKNTNNNNNNNNNNNTSSITLSKEKRIEVIYYFVETEYFFGYWNKIAKSIARPSSGE